MTQSCIVLASSSQLSFSCFDRLSHITKVMAFFETPSLHKARRGKD